MNKNGKKTVGFPGPKCLLRNDGNEELRLTAHRLWSSTTPGRLLINDQQIWQENSQVSRVQTFTDRPLQSESDGEGLKSGNLRERAPPVRLRQERCIDS